MKVRASKRVSGEASRRSASPPARESERARGRGKPNRSSLQKVAVPPTILNKRQVRGKGGMLKIFTIKYEEKTESFNNGALTNFLADKELLR